MGKLTGGVWYANYAIGNPLGAPTFQVLGAPIFNASSAPSSAFTVGKGVANTQRIMVVPLVGPYIYPGSQVSVFVGQPGDAIVGHVLYSQGGCVSVVPVPASTIFSTITERDAPWMVVSSQNPTSPIVDNDQFGLLALAAPDAPLLSAGPTQTPTPAISLTQLVLPPTPTSVCQQPAGSPVYFQLFSPETPADVVFAVTTPTIVPYPYPYPFPQPWPRPWPHPWPPGPPPPPPPHPLPGGDRDAHGCIPSAGYVWCPITGRCIRPWEEPCGGPRPGPPPPRPPPGPIPRPIPIPGPIPVPGPAPIPGPIPLPPTPGPGPLPPLLGVGGAGIRLPAGVASHTFGRL